MSVVIMQVERIGDNTIFYTGEILGDGTYISMFLEDHINVLIKVFGENSKSTPINNLQKSTKKLYQVIS